MSLRIVPPTGAAPQPGDCAALAPVAAALPPGDTTTPQSADTAAPQPGDSAAPQPASATRGAQASNTHASQAPRYWAFISYSHRDEKLAKSLQRKLETYRLPKRLVGRDGAHGPVPAQAKPVFRDRDELHAGADLAAHVQAALATSRWLVVLCTPNAARSPWVEREIVAFKRLHGEGRVLALIAAGEPFASRLPGREEEECFPNALRHALGPQGEADGADQEPIAADMRLHGDGPRRATLKLLAGMVGVGFDELVRRDHARRLRWLTGLAGASTLLTAVLTVLTVLAVQARNDARQQREQAEGLIEFMLGDLRKKLEPVGRLDVLDAVGEKALAHYDAQSSDFLDATALGHRSRALHLIGEMRQKRGQLAEALLAYERAAATTERLLEKAPRDPQRVFDHAQSAFWIGYVALERGLVPQAERAFLEYRQLAQRLVELQPGHAPWRLELAYSTTNLGVLQVEHGQPAESLATLGEAAVLYRALMEDAPERAVDLAHTYGWQAVAHFRLAQYERAIEMQVAKKALFLGMPEANKDQRSQQGVQNASMQLAAYELARGDVSAAREHAREATLQAERLAAADPANLNHLDAQCYSRLLLAETELLLGNQQVARLEVLRMWADRPRLLSADASQIDVHVGTLGRALALAARTAALSPAQLLSEMNAYLAHVDRTVATGTVLDRRNLHIVALVHYQLGRLLLAQGRRDEGLRHWQAASARLGAVAAGDDFAILLLLAKTQWALGEHGAARALLARIQASPFRHPELEVLRQEMAPRAGPPPKITTKKGSFQ